jgi:hypothetical protein
MELVGVVQTFFFGEEDVLNELLFRGKSGQDVLMPVTQEQLVMVLGEYEGGSAVAEPPVEEPVVDPAVRDPLDYAIHSLDLMAEVDSLEEIAGPDGIQEF